MDRARKSPSAPRDGQAGQPDRRALEAMANAARRAQLLTSGPPAERVEPAERAKPAERVEPADRAKPAQRVEPAERTKPAQRAKPAQRVDEETGDRRLVARTTLGRNEPSATRSSIAPPSRPWRPGRGTGGAAAPDVDGAGSAARQTRWGLQSSPRMRSVLVGAIVGVLLIVGAVVALDMALRSPARKAASRTSAGHQSSASQHHNAVPRTSTAGSSGKSPRATSGTTGAASSTTAPSTTAPSTAAPSTTAPSATAPSTSASSTSARATTAPSTTVAPASLGAPRLSSASPSSGRAGQVVVVDGSGLYSSSGNVVAYFGGASARTRCSSQSSCTVTVPDLGSRPSAIPLTIRTTQGRSNALTFAYA